MALRGQTREQNPQATKTTAPAQAPAKPDKPKLDILSLGEPTVGEPVKTARATALSDAEQNAISNWLRASKGDGKSRVLPVADEDADKALRAAIRSVATDLKMGVKFGPSKYDGNTTLHFQGKDRKTYDKPRKPREPKLRKDEKPEAFKAREDKYRRDLAAYEAANA